MKKFLLLLTLTLAVTTTGCAGDVPDAVTDNTTDTHTADDTVVVETTALQDRLWEDDGYYLTEYEGGYALYTQTQQSEAPYAVFSEYHVVKCFGKDGGEVAHHVAIGKNAKGMPVLYYLGGDEGAVLAYTAKESLAVYGDWFVIDGILNTPQMRVRGKVTGEPIEESPRYDGVITFEEARCYLADADTLIHESDDTDYIAFTDGFNGELVGLYRVDGELRGRSFLPDLGADYGGRVYVRETELTVIDSGDYGEYGIFAAGDCSFVLDKDGAVVLSGNGTYEDTARGYLVFFPSDLQRPKTIYNPDLSLFCDGVMNWTMMDEGIFAYTYTEYKGDAWNYDDQIHLFTVSYDGEVTEYGTFDKPLYLSYIYEQDGVKKACALMENDGVYSLIDSTGKVIFEIEKTVSLYYYGVSFEDGYAPEVMRFIFADNSTRDIDGTTRYTEYFYNTKSGEYGTLEYTKIPYENLF